MPNLSQSSEKSKSFYKISNGDKLLFVQAFILCGFARAIILLIQFNKIRTYIGTYKKESSFHVQDSKYQLVTRIAWAVNSASPLTPWKSKCFVKALTAQKMLKNHNIYSTLYLGVAKEGERDIKAHAWLRCGELIVTGGEDKDNFKEVARFSNEK